MKTATEPEAQKDEDLMDEFEDILAEVRRQQEHERDTGHPGLAAYTLGELSQAAGALISLADDAGGTGLALARRQWPFDYRAMPAQAPGTGRRRLLVQAAANLLRELARLPRPGQSLADVPQEAGQGAEPPGSWRCESCGQINPAGWTACEDCGAAGPFKEGGRA